LGLKRPKKYLTCPDFFKFDGKTDSNFAQKISDI